MSRCDLTEFEWRVIAPILPDKPRDVPRVDHCRVLNDIFCPKGLRQAVFCNTKPFCKGARPRLIPNKHELTRSLFYIETTWRAFLAFQRPLLSSRSVISGSIEQH